MLPSKNHGYEVQLLWLEFNLLTSDSLEEDDDEEEDEEDDEDDDEDNDRFRCLCKSDFGDTNFFLFTRSMEFPIVCISGADDSDNLTAMIELLMD